MAERVFLGWKKGFPETRRGRLVRRWVAFVPSTDSNAHHMYIKTNSNTWVRRIIS